ncbi:MAG: prefoldin subunit alpha [Promethearchaeota archaeon]|nr:MAG: prefoldin subunit alpha [Candidatus Lokiarchaeota archaeon]
MQDPQDAQRQLLYQLQILRQQHEMLQNQLEIVNASLNNLLNTKSTVENLRDVKDNDEILVPIGGMISLKAIIKEPEKIFLYVSQDVVIEKNIDGTLEFLETLIEQHKEQTKYLSQQLQKVEVNLQRLSQSMQGGM